MRGRAGKRNGMTRSARHGSGGRRARCVWAALFFAVTAVIGRAQTADGSAPAIFRTSGGQFEIIGPNPTASAAVAELAERAWSQLRQPLALPERFSSAIVVRLIPAERWTDAAFFRGAVEPGGVVSMRVAWTDDLSATVVRRALVQGLLLRLAVMSHGIGPRLQVPLWLEQGCVGWWVTRRNPALLDTWQQEARGAAPVHLADLLTWQRGAVEPRGWELAALWWFSELAGRPPAEAHRVQGFLSAVLGGADSGVALEQWLPDTGQTAAERERWWQVVAHEQATQRTMPWWTAAESRERLRDGLRVVLAQGAGGPDRLLTAADLEAGHMQPAIQGVINDRLARLGLGLPWVHPYYRNAAISAGVFWEALRDGNATLMEQAQAQLIEDIRLGRELEATTSEALDALNALGS